MHAHASGLPRDQPGGWQNKVLCRGLSGAPRHPAAGFTVSSPLLPKCLPKGDHASPWGHRACPELNRTWHSCLHTQHAPRMPCRPRRCSQGPGMGRTCVRDLWAPVNGGAGMVISECPSQRDMAELDRGPMGPSPGQGRRPPAAMPHKPPAPALNVRWRQCPSELWECKEKASVAWLPVNPQATTMGLWRGPRMVCRLCAETTSARDHL